MEPEKVAIRRSRTTALLRTLIHALPIGVALFEIVLNLKGHFVGSTFDKQSSLQFGAKAHEVLMQASLATILLSYIRYQISAGKGMPFGAVLSGLQFHQVSYLWSVELWSSILSKDFQTRRKTCFTVLVLVCIAVAATAGPSSASLLIPRQGLWPIPSTYLAVNASTLDLWPDRLDENIIKRDCTAVRLDVHHNNPHCPLSDLYRWLDGDSGEVFYDLSIETFISLDVQSTGAESRVFRDIALSGCSTSSKDQYCATIPHTGFLDDFYSAQLNHLDYPQGYQSLQKNYYQPYTIASCVADVVKDASDQAPLRFARISETDPELKKDREIVSIPGLSKGQFVNNATRDNSDFRVHWIDLPSDVFNTGIPGAVVVNPQGLNDSSYNITTCTLNAGWGSSTIMSSAQVPDVIYSHMSNVPSSWLGTRSDWDIYGYVYVTKPNVANISNFSYPQRRISVSKGWMETLNPTVVLSNNSTGKLIPLWLSALKYDGGDTENHPEANMAVMLDILLATALSETGTGYDWAVFSDLKNATRTCNTCLVFEIEYSLHGWLYSARGSTIILAITVMLAYCALALGHIIYSAISGVSSTAWDSAAELVALAMNSSPTAILQNTCAGIIGRQALKTPVRVLATTPGHLELVFGTVNGRNAPASKLVINEKYGNLTVKKAMKKGWGSMRQVRRHGKGMLLGARSMRRLRQRSESTAQISLRKRAVTRSSE